jgi:hypothetical protein
LSNVDLTTNQKLQIVDKYQQEELNLVKDAVEKEKKLQQDKFASIMSMASKYVDDIKAVMNSVAEIGTQQNEQELRDFNNKEADKLTNLKYNSDVAIKTAQDEADAGKITSEELAKRKVDIANQQAEDEYKIKLEQYNFDKAMKHKQFERNKKLQLAGAVMDTASGIMKSLASAPLAVGVVPNPVGIASLATVVATGIAQIAKIASMTEDQGQEAPKPPILQSYAANGGTSGSSSSGSNFAAPNFFRLGQGPDSTKNPQRVYVVETDITNAQQRAARAEVRATATLLP